MAAAADSALTPKQEAFALAYVETGGAPVFRTAAWAKMAQFFADEYHAEMTPVIESWFAPRRPRDPLRPAKLMWRP